MRTYKEDHKLMDLLGLKEISRIICDTNMGTLKLRLRKGETEYRFVLDAVELPKALNKETMELLFPLTVEVPIPTQTPPINNDLLKVIKTKKNARKSK